jgi:hypothetical protein
VPGCALAAPMRFAAPFRGDSELSGRDWHVALLENMSLDIEGVRPRVLSDESVRLLRQLLAFTHFFRHAYAVSLEAQRLESLKADMLALSAPLDADLDALDEHLALAARE